MSSEVRTPRTKLTLVVEKKRMLPWAAVRRVHSMGNVSSMTVFNGELDR